MSIQVPKTRLDLLLDGVKARERELVLDLEGYTRDQVQLVLDTARDRGLHASFDGRFVLIRDLR